MATSESVALANATVIASDPAETVLVQEPIERALRALLAAEQEIYGIRLAIEEALLNAIKHGNQLDPAKKVRVAWQLRANHFEIAIRDEGAGFDPDDVPDPTDIENLERPCGRGLLLMRHYMTAVEIQPPGNAVRMYKTLRNGACP